MENLLWSEEEGAYFDYLVDEEVQNKYNYNFFRSS